MSKTKRNKHFRNSVGTTGEDFVNGQKNSTLPEKDLEVNPILTQIKLLQDHYLSSSRQPTKIRCAIDLAPPQARASCPQIKYGGFLSVDGGNSAYGPDVPKAVVEKSKVIVLGGRRGRGGGIPHI